MTVLQELNTKLSFSGDISPLTKMNTKLTSGISLLGGLKTKLIASTIAIVGAASKVLSFANTIDNLSFNSGIAVNKIQALSYASSKMGGTANDARSAISSLSAKIGEASLFGSDAFAKIGLSIYKNNGQLKSALDIIKDVNKEFKTANLAPQQKLAILQQLGLPTSFNRLLSESPKQLNTLLKKAPRIDPTALKSVQQDRDISVSALSAGVTKSLDLSGKASIGARYDFSKASSFFKNLFDTKNTPKKSINNSSKSTKNSINNTFNINVSNKDDGEKFKKHITDALNTFSKAYKAVL